MSKITKKDINFLIITSVAFSIFSIIEFGLYDLLSELIYSRNSISFDFDIIFSYLCFFILSLVYELYGNTYINIYIGVKILAALFFIFMINLYSYIFISYLVVTAFISYKSLAKAMQFLKIKFSGLTGMHLFTRYMLSTLLGGILFAFMSSILHFFYGPSIFYGENIMLASVRFMILVMIAIPTTFILSLLALPITNLAKMYLDNNNVHLGNN